MNFTPNLRQIVDTQSALLWFTQMQGEDGMDVPQKPTDFHIIMV